MKKVLSLLFAASLLLMPVVGFAYHDGTQQVHELQTGITDVGGLFDLLNTIANWIFTGLLVVAVIFILLAAYTFMTAGGDPGKVTEARNKILYAAVGVIVAVAAKGLVLLAENLVG